MRLILITLGVFAALSLLFGFLRSRGLDRQYAPFEHPWLEAKSPWVFYFEDPHPSFTEIRSVFQNYPEASLWFDLGETSDGKIAFFSPYFHPDDRSKEGPLKHRPWSELEPLGYRQLEELFEAFPFERFVLRLNDNSFDIQERWAELLRDHNPDRFLLHSDFDLVTQTTKEIEPFWLFGIGRGDRSRLQIANSMWIEPFIRIRGDVWISPLRRQGRDLLDKNLAAELRRRHKIIMLGPLQGSADLQKAKDLGGNFYLIAWSLASALANSEQGQNQHR